MMVDGAHSLKLQAKEKEGQREKIYNDVVAHH